jgi:hypothetical protein
MRPNPLGSKRRNKPTSVERKPSWKGRAKESSDIWEAAKRPNALDKKKAKSRSKF